jgi:hypothetical protein
MISDHEATMWGYGFIYGFTCGAMVMGIMFLAWLLTTPP